MTKYPNPKEFPIRKHQWRQTQTNELTWTFWSLELGASLGFGYLVIGIFSHAKIQELA